MLRQRIRARRSRLAVLGRLPLLVLSLALVWYGLMVVLLAFKVSPQTVNALSGYRSAYDFLAGLEPADITGGRDRRLVSLFLFRPVAASVANDERT